MVLANSCSGFDLFTNCKHLLLLLSFILFYVSQFCSLCSRLNSFLVNFFKIFPFFFFFSFFFYFYLFHSTVLFNYRNLFQNSVNPMQFAQANGKASEQHYENDLRCAGNHSDDSCVFSGKIGLSLSNWHFDWRRIHRIIFIHVCLGNDQPIGEH